MTMYYEARRIKGQEYENISQKRSISFMGNDNTGKFGTTSYGKGGVLDSTAQSQIEKLDIEKEKLLLESNNILKEYDEYVQGNIQHAIETYEDESENNLGKRMAEDINALKNNIFSGLSENDIFKLIRDEYYGGNAIYRDLGIDPNNMSSEDQRKAESALRRILALRMNYVKKITSLMSKMLQLNYKELGLSERQAQQYIASLSGNDNEAVKTAGKIKDLIKNNADKYVTNGGDSIDLTSLGFGVILGPSKGYRLRFIDLDNSNEKSMLMLLQKAMRYDVVVVAHGTSTQDAYVRKGLRNKKTTQVYLNAIDDTFKNYTGLVNKEAKKVNEFSAKNGYDSIVNIVSSVLLNLDIGSRIKQEDLNNFNKNFTSMLKNTDNPQKVVSGMVKMTENVYSREKEYISKTLDDTVKSKLSNEDYNTYTSKIKKQIGTYLHGYISYTIYNILRKDIQSTVKLNPLQKTYWGCQPTRTLKAGPFDDVNDLVRQLIKEGYKKICIEDCNPGGHQLADDIMKTKGVIINYSNFSNYIESEIIDTNDPFMVSIMEAEQSIIEYASANGVDYHDAQYLSECMEWYENGCVVQEGVVDTLKEFIRKIAAAIVGFFRWLISLVKRAYESIKGLFSGTKESPKDKTTKFEKPIETNLIDIKNKKVEKTIATNREDLDKAGSEMCKSIADEVKKMNSSQNKSMQNIENDVESLSKSSSNEGVELLESVLDEFGIYDDDLWKMVYEFEVDGQNADADDLDNLPDDNDDQNQGTQDTQDQDNGPAPTVTPQTQQPEDDEPYNDEDFSIDDDTQTRDDQTNDQDPQNDDQGNEGDEPEEDNDENFDIPDDNEGDTQQGEGDEQQTPEPDEPDNDDNFSMDGEDGDQHSQDNGDESEGSGLSDDESYQDTKLKELETVAFEDLSDTDKKVKIRELKDLYGNIFDKCKSLADRVNDIQKDSETIQVVEYINESLINLRQYIKDYLDNVFDSKTYIENLTQIQKYLAVLNSINTIFVELGKDNNQ